MESGQFLNFLRGWNGNFFKMWLDMTTGIQKIKVRKRRPSSSKSVPLRLRSASSQASAPSRSISPNTTGDWVKYHRANTTCSSSDESTEKRQLRPKRHKSDSRLSSSSHHTPHHTPERKSERDFSSVMIKPENYRKIDLLNTMGELDLDGESISRYAQSAAKSRSPTWSSVRHDAVSLAEKFADACVDEDDFFMRQKSEADMHNYLSSSTRRSRHSRNDIVMYERQLGLESLFFVFLDKLIDLHLQKIMRQEKNLNNKRDNPASLFNWRDSMKTPSAPIAIESMQASAKNSSLSSSDGNAYSAPSMPSTPPCSIRDGNPD